MIRALAIAILPSAAGTAWADDAGDPRLARSLAGRSAARAEPCLRPSRLSGSQIVGRTGIVYGTADATLWGDRPVAGRDMRDASRILAPRTAGSRPCRDAIGSLIDRHARVETGMVVLNDFIPDRRQASAGAISRSSSNPAAVSALKEPRP